MHAVVMAAGEGRRLRPLTERWAKTVLPIAGRPVIATLMRELAAAGLAEATVVTGHLGDQVEALVGDGSAFGLSVRYAHQPEPVGSADAVRRALAVGAQPPLLVTAADTVFRPGDLSRAAERWLAAGAPGGITVRRAEPDERSDRPRIRVGNGRVLRVVEPEESSHVSTPAWFLDDGLAASLESLGGPPFELAAAFQQALDAGDEILALEIGPTRDLTRPADVITRNFPYLSARG